MPANRKRIVVVALSGLAAVLLAGTAITVAQVQAQKQAMQAKPASAADVAFYDNEVLPVLKANCYKCHAEGKAKGGLSLADRFGLLKGGELGPVISLERPEESLILKAINHRDGLEMP